MKIVFVWLVTICSVCFAVDNSYENLCLVKQVRKEFIAHACKKYNIRCAGAEGSFPKKVESIGVIFGVNKLLSIDESRVLMVNLIKDFQEMINANQKITAILSDVPFPADRVNITLHLHDGDSEGPSDFLSHIFTARGNIVYSTSDTEKSIFEQVKMKESLEEACEKTGVKISLIRSSYSDYFKKREKK